MNILGRGPNPRILSSPRTGKILLWESVLVNEEVRFGHKSPRRWSEDECLLDQSKSRFDGVVCHSGQRSRKFY